MRNKGITICSTGRNISPAKLVRLRAVILSRGLNPERLAELCGVTPKSISNLLSGNYSKPGLWRKLERVLDLPIVSSPEEFRRIIQEGK